MEAREIAEDMAEYYVEGKIDKVENYLQQDLKT